VGMLRRRLNLRRAGLWVLTACGLQLGGCSSSPDFNAPKATLAADQSETAIVAISRDIARMKAMADLASRPSPLPPTPTPGAAAELTTYIQSLVNKFVAQSPTPNRQIKATVTECDSFTDETALDGNLRFCLSTLRHLGSESEIAFIAAHETAHALLGHTMGDGERKAAQQKKINTTYFFLGPNGRTAAETQAANENAAIKREQEREADLFGIDLMVKAGFNPNGAYTFFDLKRRSLLAKASYRDMNEAAQKGRITRSMAEVKEFSDLGKVTAYAIMNEGDNAIMSNLDDKDHATAEQAMKVVAEYIKKNYQSATARPLNSPPWKAKAKSFPQTTAAFR
jgi:predicted Zn-dependent protease